MKYTAVKVPGNLQKTRLRVLVWTEHFFGDNYLEPVRVPRENADDIQMSFTQDRGELANVDAIWFHGPDIEDMPPRSEKRQPWVLMSMESDVNYPALKNPIARMYFDLYMTYRLDADIPCIYPNWHQYGDFMQQPLMHQGPSGGALACYIASNPVAYRDDYVRELMHYLPVDSLGGCLSSSKQDFVVGRWEQGAWDSILGAIPHYKFYLAFENSCSVDYVTERVFHALACGTVPIYFGADNVRDFMPAPESLIIASEFQGPEELARYLHHLDQNDDAYQKHLQWKIDGYSCAFRELVDFGSTEPRQRLAVKLAHGCDRSCNCGGRRREPGSLN